MDRWQGPRAYYQRRLAEIYSFLIPPGMRVLEVGCGRGDLLAALKPAYGVGVDFCPAMLERARRRHPELHFVEADAHELDLNETFDYIVCLDLVNDLWDVQQVFENLARHCHPGTRVILNAYSRLWEIAAPHRRRSSGLAHAQLTQNWLAPGDVENLLYLADLDLIRASQEILWPFWTPPLHQLANKYLVKMAPFRWFALANLFHRPSAARAGASRGRGQRGGGGAQ